MWLFLFFDLPQVSVPEKRQAQQFRQFLLDDGFMMIQWSVYARVCNGEERVNKHVDRIAANLPPEGHIRTITITDKQYNHMQIVLGNKKPTEKHGYQQLLLL